VKRTFGNKTSWDRPFPEHFRKFAGDYNNAVFSNERINRATNLNALQLEDGDFDLVYIDTPYLSATRGPADYYGNYHFLEGLCLYLEGGGGAWLENIDRTHKHLPLKRGTTAETAARPWTKKDLIVGAFEMLFTKFEKSTLVVSYNTGGIPSEEEMRGLLEVHGKTVSVLRRPYKYYLRQNHGEELLFVAV
jgi:adenine-specific DNA methylase